MHPVRRILPWALLGLLAVGTAAGAAAGQLQTPTNTPAEWVDSVFAATQAAGTAHIRFSDITTSPNPTQASTRTGIGAIDFTDGNYRVAEPGQSTIVIGQTIYTDLTGASDLMGWSTAHVPRSERRVGGFGLDDTGALDAVAGLAGPTPVDGVHALGRGSVDGIAATRYMVTTAPLYICGPHGRTLLAYHYAPTTLWVNGQGRLVQARTSIYMKGFRSHGPRDASGFEQPIVTAPSTIVATLTLSRFGAPVRVTAPQVPRSGPESNMIVLRPRGRSSPCRG
jgi:hypothetical protein